VTQRGNNAAAQLDSVAAYSRIVTKTILLGEGTLASRFLDANDPAQQRGYTAGGGRFPLRQCACLHSPEQKRASRRTEWKWMPHLTQVGQFEARSLATYCLRPRALLLW
jgi:hypothetical protein